MPLDTAGWRLLHLAHLKNMVREAEDLAEGDIVMVRLTPGAHDSAK